MSYEGQTNAQLLSLVDDLGIEVESKNQKPNKAELIAALDNYYGVSEETEDEDVQVEEETSPKKSKKTNKKVEAAKKKREQYKVFMRLVRVNVTSNAQNQTKAAPNQVLNVTWGNEVLGYHTDRLVLGKPWHIRFGALQNLKNAVIVQSVQNDEENRVDTIEFPAYNIIELPMLNKKELEKLAKKQTIRDESLDALVD